MPYSYTTITLQGSTAASGTNGVDQKVFGPFDFDYITTDDIKLVFSDPTDDVLKSVAIASVDPATKLVTLVNNLSSGFTTSPSVTPGGTAITSHKARIYRATSLSPIVDFQSGSRISEADLDTAYRQALFAAQETSEDSSGSGTRTLQATDDIGDGAISAVKLATDSVEEAKIKNLNVTAGKLADNAVETDKIKNLNVNSDKLAADAVETSKIDDGAVTAPKLASTLDLSGNTLTFPSGGIVQGEVDTATQTEMETEASAGICVPETLKHHPGIAKAYGRFTGTGAGSNNLEAGSYNVASVATSSGDPGDDKYTRVTLSNAMADTNYIVTANEEQLSSVSINYAPAANGVTVNIISTTQFDIGTDESAKDIAFVVHGKLA